MSSTNRKGYVYRYKNGHVNMWCGLRPGFTFSFFYRIPPTAGNEILTEISPNFSNSEQKENSNSKNEISVGIRWFSTGKWCQLWFFYCFGGQMKNFWIPTLFSFSRSRTFVSGTFSFEQWFESYLIISKNFHLNDLSFHVTSFELNAIIHENL